MSKPAELVLYPKGGVDVRKFAQETVLLLRDMPVTVSVLDGADHIIVRGDAGLLAHLGDHLHNARTA